jgi:phosphatidylethanolamine/phosphatidyl-N-methylethanolamine N-methyltransferase
MKAGLASLKGYLRDAVVSLRAGATVMFLREMLKHPARVGAVWPSSVQLSCCMAQGVLSDGTGLVVELGAGTGAVTQALLDRGIGVDRLLIVERSPIFVAHLRRRFPLVRVIHGDATELGTLIPANTDVSAIISSVPLRSLSRADAAAIISQWLLVLSPGGCVVQFTYALLGSFGRRAIGFVQTANNVAWANLPPARVVTLKRQ